MMALPDRFELQFPVYLPVGATRHGSTCTFWEDTQFGTFVAVFTDPSLAQALAASISGAKALALHGPTELRAFLQMLPARVEYFGFVCRTGVCGLAKTCFVYVDDLAQAIEREIAK